MTDAIPEAWRRVEAARDGLKAATIAGLFEADPRRFERFSARLDDLLLDISKTLLDEAALQALLGLARAASPEARRDALFAGAPVNATEGRAALHPALRARREDGFAIDGEDVMAEVLEERERCLDFAEKVRQGRIAAADGRPFTDVVNIGIGGSDLGPAMAVPALAPFHDGPRCHFVSNVDGAHVAGVLGGLDPARTLVLVASKTFTTVETMTNARTARAWMTGALGERAGAHFAAISTAHDHVAEFGIAADRIFGFWDWVGGRYSVWSAIGLSLMIAIGRRDFEAFLEGARSLDRHFLEAPLEANLPVLMALVDVWHRNALGMGSRAVVPYDQRLARLPAYLQQLDMESNGKSARLGPGLSGETGPVVWGEPGTNGQHAFFQLLHQGTDAIPVEFIAAAEPGEREFARAHGLDLRRHHQLLLANCLAQSEALMRGRGREEAIDLMLESGLARTEAERLAPHRTFPGNRPSVTLIHRRLDPFSLGRLLALHEHRVFAEGAIWGVNSFDQWGVELGKTLAKTAEPLLTGAAADADKDASTFGLAAWIRDLQGA